MTFWERRQQKLAEKLNAIRVLYLSRGPSVPELWGYTFELLRGETPQALFDPDWEPWVYLGPDFYREKLPEPLRSQVQTFLAPIEAGGWLPKAPGEWTTHHQWEGEPRPDPLEPFYQFQDWWETEGHWLHGKAEAYRQWQKSGVEGIPEHPGLACPEEFLAWLASDPVEGRVLTKAQKERKARAEARRQQLQAAAEEQFRQSAAILDQMEGQPILIGHHSEKRHRRQIEKAHAKARKGGELFKAAQRAPSEKTAGTAILSDDPEALEALRAKLAGLEQAQARDKEINAAWRKSGAEGLRALGFSPADVARVESAIAEAYSWEKQPVSKWRLENRNKEIHRVRERIASLEKLDARREEEPVRLEGPGWELEEDLEAKRLRLRFDRRLTRDEVKIMRFHGFLWSPSNTAWQRQIADLAKAHWLAKQAIKEILGEAALPAEPPPPPPPPPKPPRDPSVPLTPEEKLENFKKNTLFWTKGELQGMAKKEFPHLTAAQRSLPKEALRELLIKEAEIRLRAKAPPPPPPEWTQEEVDRLVAWAERWLAGAAQPEPQLEILPVWAAPHPDVADMCWQAIAMILEQDGGSAEAIAEVKAWWDSLH